MKVTHIFKTYFPDTQGGLEESIRHISRYTKAHGVENRILTVSKRGTPVHIQYSESSVTRYKTTLDVLSNPISIQFYKEFSKAISDCDILHFHFPWPFAEINYLIKKPNIPTIVTYHSDIVKHSLLKILYRPFIYNFLQNVDLIVPTSLNYLNSSEDLSPFRDKCTVINLTIDHNRFPSLSENLLEEVKAEYGDNFFLFVGVLRKYKGLDYLLEAMKGIDRRLIIIGKGVEEKKLKQKARSLGLSNVLFLGYVSDKYLSAFYTLCRAFVFPSIDRSEAFGISLLEASSFSKPMISTELYTGTSYINKNAETGIVIPPKNSNALHRALKILSGDTDLCLQYGKNAKDRFEKKFNSSITGEHYLRIYDNLIEKKHHKTYNHLYVKRYYPLVNTIKEFSFFHPPIPCKVSRSQKPKIIFLITEDWYFWSHRLPLARAARDAGFDVIIATRVKHHGEKITNEGFELVPIRLQRKNREPMQEIKAFFEIIKIYKNKKPDIVHHVGIKPVLYGSLAARIINVSGVVNALAGLGSIFVSKGKYNKILRKLVMLSYRIMFSINKSIGILQNPEDLSFLVEAGVLKKKQTTLIRGAGVNLSKFSYKPESKRDEVIIICASRMIWDKGIGDFVEAAKILQKKYQNCRFILIGVPDPENPTSISEKTLRNWHSAGTIEWWGYQADMPQILQESDIVVLPSVYGEGVPKILIEAAACGRAVVTTNIPGCREIVRDNVNGLLVPPHNSNALADAISKLIDNNVTRERMGREGRRIAEKEFSEDLVVEKTMGVYNRLLEQINGMSRFSTD